MQEHELRDAYLSRLGLTPEPPSPEALVRLHRAHVERVPWETLWIQSGERWGTDPVESARRIATVGRGGYCFHLNGGFSWLLGTLGYEVCRHVGGVHGPDGPASAEMTNHLVLTVHGQPTEANRTGDWYVDVGLGDAMHEPLPLRDGTHRSGPFTLTLRETPGAVGDWHLDHDPRGAFVGMSWRTEPCSMSAFGERHDWLSTSADSRFVKYLCVQRRDAHGADVLQGLLLQRVGGSDRVVTLTTQSELLAALAEVFGVDVGGLAPEARALVWTRAEAAHREWQAARG